MKELLLHSLVVSPIVRWIASPHRRWSRKTGIKIAFVCLVLLALLQLRRMELNCYELIGVNRGASSAELTKAMRKRASLFHPDRPEPDSLDLPFGFSTREEVFVQLQKCQETVTSVNKFHHYNRFGKVDFAYKNEDALIPVMAIFAVIGYLANFVVCTTFTAAPENQASRYWIFSYLLFAMASELFLKFLGQANIFSFIPYFSNWMVFEQVEAIKALIPSILSSGVLLSQLTHVDDSEMYQEVLQSVSDSNREIAAHIASKRNNPEISAPLVPAVIKLMRGQPRIATTPQTPPQGGVNVSDQSAEGAKPPTNPTQSGITFQKMMNWLFYAYLIKSVFGFIRSLL